MHLRQECREAQGKRQAHRKQPVQGKQPVQVRFSLLRQTRDKHRHPRLIRDKHRHPRLIRDKHRNRLPNRVILSMPGTMARMISRSDLIVNL